MDKRTFFLSALKAGAYLRKEWIVSVFSVIHPSTLDANTVYAFKLVAPEDPKAAEKTGGFWQFMMYNDSTDSRDANGIVTGSKADEPIFRFRDPLELKPGDLPNVKEPVKTTYGNALYNMIVLCWPFGNKIPYQTGYVSGRSVDKKVAALLADLPPEGKSRQPDKIYIDEYLKYTDAVSSLAGLASLCVPAASPKTMTVDPAIIKRRDELFEQYKDQLNDKAIVAKIEKELVEMDQASFKGDPAEDFFIVPVTYTVRRKRCHISFGVDEGFAEASKSVTIKASLREGIDMSEMPTMVDSVRAGSFNRGAETALGGESVKYFYRVFQNTKVAEEDCGVKNGVEWLISESNINAFEGLWMISNGVSTLLTKDQISKYIGRKISVRSPLLCKTQAPSFCAKCVGTALASNPTSLHIAASSVGSAFMGAAMSAMHGKALLLKRFDPKVNLT